VTISSDLEVQLRRGPSIALLGQASTAIEGTDGLLSAIVAKYGGSQSAVGYYGLLDSSASEAAESALAWMHAQAAAIKLGNHLSTIALFPWNAVYTSSISSTIVEIFRSDWRQTEPIFDETYQPSNPRNRLLLHITQLFGSVSQTEPLRRPPLTRFEWRKHRQNAIALLRRLPELVTPMGCLVIDGLHASDWLTNDDLPPVLDEFGLGQVHVFHPPLEFRENSDIQYLERQGKMLFYSENLAAFLEAGAGKKQIRLGPPAGAGSQDRFISIAGEPKAIPSDLWGQVSRCGTVLEDRLRRMRRRPLSEDERYSEFRHFVSSSEGIPDWRGFVEGYAFRRTFEDTMYAAILSRLSARRLSDSPLILHGQTGTGKSVAVSSLAFRVNELGQYPVLFIERKAQRPNTFDIEAFCRWSENEGADGTLVVWDGMLDTDTYLGLHRFLSAKGRKAVIVGTCYRIVPPPSGDQVIEASADLSQEIDAFSKFLGQFQQDLAAFVASRIRVDSTFLSALYRVLPASRATIRTGVAREVNFAEHMIGDLAAEIASDSTSETALASALRSAGLITSPAQLSKDRISSLGGEIVNEIQELTGLVMVAGQFGLAIPLELLMRALGKKTAPKLTRILSQVDIFRWNYDVVGNIAIGPRNSLEAELLVQTRMGGAQTEIAFARRLLLEIHESGSFGSADREVNFAVDLLRRLGSSGNKKSYYQTYFLDLASTLRELRERRGVVNPRLMLQEANLIREWVMAAGHDLDSLEVESHLGAVKKILEEALLVPNTPSLTKSFLLVELASTLASQARAIKSSNLTKALAWFDEARQSLNKARVANPSTYHPIDVMVWATRDMLDVLPPDTRIEAIADVLHMFQTSNPDDFDLDQQDKYLSRRVEIGDLIDHEDIASDAFSELDARGSSAGYYVRAYRASGLPQSAEMLNDPLGISRIESGLAYLRKYWEKICHDSRCLDLVLDLWWYSHVKTKFFEYERSTIPLNLEKLRECLDILLALEQVGDSQRPVLLMFLRALIVFHLGDVDQAIDLFRLVESESYQIRGRWRIIRSYIVSLPSGAPRKFHGNVAWASEERGRGEVYVEELRRKIQFIPREFGRGNLIRGESLGEFHIAFNFLGPLAEPVTYYKHLKGQGALA
jgi:hypothetical protein